MQIGTLHIQGRTFLAPLAGITNLPFRLLVKNCGCAVVCTEMISAKGMIYHSRKTQALLASRTEEKPLSVQLFGSEPEIMADCAQIIQEMNIAQILDINFGCSVRKVIKQGAGAALMKTPDLARSILTAVRKAVDMPLTIKTRSGWDASGQDAFRIARIAQDAGVDAIILHPRTATQGFKGKADWELIRQIKQLISLPIIGNGDIVCLEDALAMFSHTGCDGIMVGRATLSNPFILSQIDSFLETGTSSLPSRRRIFDAMIRLTNGYMDHFGEENACRMLRGRLAWFAKGLPGCAAFRKNLAGIVSRGQALDLIREFEISGV